MWPSFEDSEEAHGKCLGSKEIGLIKMKFNWPCRYRPISARYPHFSGRYVARAGHEAVVDDGAEGVKGSTGGGGLPSEALHASSRAPARAG